MAARAGEGGNVALVLLSGGLDSVLAAKVLMEQGVAVSAICFTSPFFGSVDARRASERLGIGLLEEDLTEELLRIIRGPRHGFGKNMNPCIDCHAAMIRRTLMRMDEMGARFVATGEVLGERPMSQNRQALDTVAREAGRPELVLRPLSAKLLKPTLPELEGWVDREGLLDIQGRSRRRQMEMAERWGIDWYRSPAGGCLLTDPGYSGRLRRLMEEKPDFDRHDVDLLGIGRHFWVDGCHIVIGRNSRENQELAGFSRPGDLLLKERGRPGPLALLRNVEEGAEPGEGALRKAAELLGIYGKGKQPLQSEEVEEWSPDLGAP